MFSLRAIDTVLSAIDAQRAAMLETLAALVALPTENPPATQYLPCVELIAALLARLDVPHERIDIPSPADASRASVRAWIGKRGPTLHFHGHYDVVPAMTHSAGRVLGHRGSDSSIPIRFSRWSTVFLFLATRSARITRPVNSPAGHREGCGARRSVRLASDVDRPHSAASCVGRRPSHFRWWIQLVGHVPFVGLPIVTTIRASAPRLDKPDVSRPLKGREQKERS